MKSASNFPVPVGPEAITKPKPDSQYKPGESGSNNHHQMQAPQSRNDPREQYESEKNQMRDIEK